MTKADMIPTTLPVPASRFTATDVGQRIGEILAAFSRCPPRLTEVERGLDLLREAEDTLAVASADTDGGAVAKALAAIDTIDLVDSPKDEDTERALHAARSALLGTAARLLAREAVDLATLGRSHLAAELAAAV